MLVAVTDHAVERYRQRIGGSIDARTDIAARVGRAWAAGRHSEEPPRGVRAAARGSVYVHDLDDRRLVYICRRGDGELVVITLWEREDGVPGVGEPRVPRRFTDALERG